MSYEAMHKVRASGLTDRTQVDVLEALAFFHNKETGACFPSTEAIARVSRVNDRTVRLTLKALHELGFVSSIQKPGQKRYFTLHLDRLPVAELLQESTPLYESTPLQEITGGAEVIPLQEITGEGCKNLQETPVKNYREPLQKLTPEQGINKEYNKINNKVCIAPSAEPLENLVKDTPENGTTQKRDNPKTGRQSSQKRDNGSTENGTTVVPKTVHDSINTLSTTQSCTQSIDAPASDDLFDEPVQMVEKPKKKTTDRGSRLTIDVLPDDWKAFAEAEEPDLDPYRLFDNFKDYWTSVSGAKAIKKDWTATWRNFVRSFNNAPDWKRRPMLKNGVNPNRKPTDPQYGIGVCQPIPEEEVHWLTDEERAESRRQMEAEGYAPF